MYAGGLIGSFAAGALFIAANLIANHETAEGANLVVNDERMNVTFIGLRERHFKPGVYPGIFEVKERIIKERGRARGEICGSCPLFWAYSSNG